LPPLSPAPGGFSLSRCGAETCSSLKRDILLLSLRDTHIHQPLTVSPTLLFTNHGNSPEVVCPILKFNNTNARRASKSDGKKATLALSLCLSLSLSRSVCLSRSLALSVSLALSLSVSRVWGRGGGGGGGGADGGPGGGPGKRGAGGKEREQCQRAGPCPFFFQAAKRRPVDRRPAAPSVVPSRPSHVRGRPRARALRRKARGACGVCPAGGGQTRKGALPAGLARRPQHTRRPVSPCETV